MMNKVNHVSKEPGPVQDHLRPPALLLEAALEQVRGPHVDAVTGWDP
jgi:hypothetical protein